MESSTVSSLPGVLYLSFFVAGDLLTTWWILRTGGREVGLIARAVSRPRDQLLVGILLKGIVTVFLFSQPKSVLWIGAIIGIIVTTFNVWSILSSQPKRLVWW